MSERRTPEAGDQFTIAYPFILEDYTAFDADGPCVAQSWRPGVRFVPLPPYGEDTAPVADGLGLAHFTVVSVHKPAHYPARVFFTRRFQSPSPEKRWFGKSRLHIATLEKFRRLTRGYQHSFGVGEPLEPRFGQRAASEIFERMLAEHAASADTRPKDGDAPKIAAPLASSAAPKGIAQ